jgi:hypothetical protein
MNVYIPPIIEKVYNVQGSTAAPGSGEYHRYRAMRRRERAIASAMEKEYEQRKIQKEFEDKKDMKNQVLENERLKRKRRRDAKEQKIKMKKKFLKAMEEKKDLFRKDIPLIEQVKNEIGDEEFKKMCYQEEKNYEDFDYATEKQIKNNKTMYKKGIKRNLLATQLNENEANKDQKLEQDENLIKLFPKIQPKAYEFDNYDDYEEHLQILEIIEKNEKIINEKENEEKEEKSENESIQNVKVIELEENIIIHDEDF